MTILHTCGCKFHRNWTNTVSGPIICKLVAEHGPVYPVGTVLLQDALLEYFVAIIDENGAPMSWSQVREWSE